MTTNKFMKKVFAHFNAKQENGISLTDEERELMLELKEDKSFDLTTAPNGVYAVTTEGKGMNVEDAGASCVAVALIVNNAPTPQKLMIAKSDATDGTNNTLYWGKNLLGKDVDGVVNNEKVDGTNGYGFLPKPDGSYIRTSNLSVDFNTWTAGALSDFNGKANTAAITAASSDARDMCTVLNTFNASDSHNDWYVPACGQLALMYLNMTEINAALTKIGGVALASDGSSRYWASSENGSDGGWYVHFCSGSVDSRREDNGSRVRFVRDID